VSAWEELLAATRPGAEHVIGGDQWFVMSRAYRHEPGSPGMTITVELVRAGSDLDPRRPPADAPAPPTPTERTP
jgi:hypothetical protein